MILSVRTGSSTGGAGGSVLVQDELQHRGAQLSVQQVVDALVGVAEQAMVAGAFAGRVFAGASGLQGGLDHFVEVFVD